VNGVRIYQLSRGFELWCWLCPKCLAHKKANGWEVKADKDPPHPLACDDCNNPVRELEVPF
jgi:hypothetical protein